LPCASPDDATSLRNLVSTYISHPNQLQYASRAFVSTFSGESCTFGQGSVSEGWSTQFSNHPDLSGKIYFVPAFFIDPSTFSDFAQVIDGEFNVRFHLFFRWPKTFDNEFFDQWNSAWPIEVTEAFAQQIINNSTSSSTSSNTSQPHTLLSLVTHSTAVASVETNLNTAVNSTLNNLQLALSQLIGATQTDIQYLDSLAALPNITLQARDEKSMKLTYMASVSPWFFTHYGPDSFNKNVCFSMFIPSAPNNCISCFSLSTYPINTYTRKDGSQSSVYEINLTSSKS
jgi:glucan endo-1,3-alpha-glucosidase